MKNSKYQGFELLPDSLMLEKKKQALRKVRKKNSSVPFLEETENHKKSHKDYDSDTFDDLPFVVPSKRIVIEWPVDLLKSLTAVSFENVHSKYDLEEIQIFKIASSTAKEEQKQEQEHDHEHDYEHEHEHKHNHKHDHEQERDHEQEHDHDQDRDQDQDQDHEQEHEHEHEHNHQQQQQSRSQKQALTLGVEKTISLEEPATMSIRLMSMQIYMMGGYAKKYFYNQKERSYSIRVEIKKNQESQPIKVINILEKDDMHYYPYSNNILSSFQNNHQYHRFILSQINANKRMFRLNTQQYKVQIFKFLNFKILIERDDKIHLNLKSFLPINFGDHNSKQEYDHQSKKATLLITKQNLSKLTKDGGFQILLELRDCIHHSQKNVTTPIPESTRFCSSQNYNNLDTCTGYILLSIQKV
ncbi:uncharacterized protein cubi_00922 [Cryptosporidium ubiquitum]|uniref:Uncharacterized protein n=1 Tax=Cryptosporidium ubiquitum TaxID=857276 RepID=A0A1J4M981_9CRYT|nr:uncharacterized protein cubi_00922 [Cryptosporidium ubiquitum]OII70777.1 hypothetical protein cubi_00922 [Cryptosporidium ubiquitum]